MSRFLLATSLFLFAGLALAGGSTPGDDAAAGARKPGKTTAATAVQDSDPVVGQATPAPTRSAPRPASPRWHSLLPGMIR